MSRSDSKLRELFAKTGFDVPDLEEIEIFHERTKFFPACVSTQAARIADYVTSERGIVERANNRLRFALADRIDLPKSSLPHTALASVLSTRRSCRDFTSESISLPTLSSVLSALQVVQTGNIGPGKSVSIAEFHSSHMRDAERNDVPLTIGYRPYPSAGALYPIETYVVTLRVQELQRSIWHYDPWHHGLELVTRGFDEEQLCNAVGSGRPYVSTSSVLFLHTALFERSAVKYGFRSYRFCLQEAGSIAMCISLAAAAAGLGDLQFGGTFDDLANDIIGADGVSETLVGASFCGHARPSRHSGADSETPALERRPVRSEA